MNFLKEKVRKISKMLNANKNKGLYEYENYEEYKQTQIEGNIKKINNVWATEDNIELLSKYIKENVPTVSFGLCHGTRRGVEQSLFRKYLGIEVLGTEISPTAEDFPYTIEWDFHEVKDEWQDNVDFIYSNSFDHSYNPERCLDAWMSCIKKDGICILEWTNDHMEKTKLDPFGASKKDYKKLINNKYKIKDVIKGNLSGTKKDKPTTFFIITHKNSS